MIDHSRKTGIILDLDGTLWNTADRIIPQWNAVLSENGLPEITAETMQKFMGMTPDAIADEMMPGMTHEEAMKILGKCEDRADSFLASHGGHLYSGLENTLTLLRKKYFLAVVSNCRESYLKIFLDYHGLRKYFDDYEVFGRTRLPKGDNIRLVMSRNSLGRAVYVGDTSHDFQAAEKAGVPFIWASYGFGSGVPSVHSVRSVEELPQAVANLLYIRNASGQNP